MVSLGHSSPVDGAGQTIFWRTIPCPLPPPPRSSTFECVRCSLFIRFLMRRSRYSIIPGSCLFKSLFCSVAMCTLGEKDNLLPCYPSLKGRLVLISAVDSVKRFV
ncbi:hypothetical protein CDAR_596761 [Caerostris darwini]|uniref:Uncharacterized protein n=1 Tax=Caerostris darwini TaxID=1538125 RepID=A0AAV4WBZ1_9ARAC|nr:hypothetical protein CDAR_596761 [Caerostris darwini]